jgi:putative transposase
MARLSRIVVPDLPHHVTQRGNRRMAIFKQTSDYALYRDLLAERLATHDVVCSAYCLMPNHVHLLLTPLRQEVAEASASLSRAVGEAHRRYTAFFNARARVTGHLFQGRFGCVAMDEAHWLAAVRYLAFNPVRARLCARPEDWPWSSARAHVAGRSDGLVDVRPVLGLMRDIGQWFEETTAKGTKFEEPFSSAARPLGDAAFVARIEARLGRSVTPRRRGPKPRTNTNATAV